MYTVQTENFQGPLDKLLELVQKEKLDINQVSLAKVTEGFLQYLTKIKRKEIPNQILADFLVVASKLLLIKSKVLVPSFELEEEEEEEIENLEIQLKIYKKIKKAEENIQKTWHKDSASTSREFLYGNEAIFYPSDTTITDLKNSVMNIVKEIKKLKPVEKVKRQVINLQDKIKDVLSRISKTPKGLKEFSQSGTKSEAVVLFLAILHLFRDEKVHLEQNERFGEIQIRKNG